MSELQKYIEAAQSMQSAQPGTTGWIKSANVFRDMPYTQAAALMIQAGERLALMQRAIDWCVANGYVQQLIVASDIRVPAEFAEFINARKP